MTKAQRHPAFGLAIGDRVHVARETFRGVVVAFGNRLQHAPEHSGKIRVYWGHLDQLTWEDPRELVLSGA